MTIDIRLRAEAESDLTEAASWYEDQNPELGHRFLDQIELVFSAIKKAPRSYPIVHRNIRRAMVSRFPFGVYFLIEPGLIIVIAIIHARRNPLRWKNRV